MNNLGFNISSKKDIDKLKKNKCSYLQIYYDNLNNFIYNYSKKNKIKIIVHGSFMINIANNFYKNNYSMILLKKEIRDSLKYNSYGYVLHVGKITKKNKLNEKQGIINMIKSLIYISNYFNLYNNNKFTLFLELLSGHKNDLIYKIDDLQYFLKLINISVLKNLKICLDTCHVFSSGYDLRTQQLFNIYLKEFNKKIGIKYIGLIHLNDSKNKYNSRIDQHENLGDGEIGNNIKYIYKIFNEFNIPIIVELNDIDKNIKFLIS